MFPTGGISMLVHLLTNALFSVGEYIQERSFFPFKPNTFFGGRGVAMTFLALMIMVIIGSAGLLMRNALAGETNLDLLTPIIYPCEPFEVSSKGKKIVLRIDDVQAYGWADVSRQMVADALEREIPLVLGVIPKGLRDDTKTYSYLRSNRCNLEFAVHGWDNARDASGGAEFQNLPASEAKKRIKKGVQVVERLSRSDVITFIPPNNTYSTGTKKALTELEIQVVSSEGEDEFDYDTTTFDFDTDMPVSADNVMAQCTKIFSDEDVCIIMLHPQDFVTDDRLDPRKYREYLLLLNKIGQADISVVRFKDFASEDKRTEGAFSF